MRRGEVLTKESRPGSLDQFHLFHTRPSFVIWGYCSIPVSLRNARSYCPITLQTTMTAFPPFIPRVDSKRDLTINTPSHEYRHLNINLARQCGAMLQNQIPYPYGQEML